MPAPYLLTCPLRSPIWTVGPTVGGGKRGAGQLTAPTARKRCAPASSYRNISDLFRINAAISGWQLVALCVNDRCRGNHRFSMAAGESPPMTARIPRWQKPMMGGGEA
jgi:hypothetical protein